MSIGSFPESLSQRILAGIILAGRSGASGTTERRRDSGGACALCGASVISESDDARHPNAPDVTSTDVGLGGIV